VVRQQVLHATPIVSMAVGVAAVGAIVLGQPRAPAQGLPPATAASPAASSPPPPSYDGIQGGLDAYRLAEQQRQANVSQQLYLNDQLRAWNGVPPSGASTTFYGYGAPTWSGYTPATAGYAPAAGPLNSIPPQANLNYAYGYGYTRPLGAVATPWGSLSVFEPWPYVPGDIYGYPYVPQPARQPIGRYEVHTSPTHWESQPVYAPSLPPVQPPIAAPATTTLPGTAATAPATVGATAREPIPPPLPAHPTTGPREY
jgi:hypothetical protein